jgi:hypothetical protein
MNDDTGDSLGWMLQLIFLCAVTGVELKTLEPVADGEKCRVELSGGRGTYTILAEYHNKALAVTLPWDTEPVFFGDLETLPIGG